MPPTNRNPCLLAASLSVLLVVATSTGAAAAPADATGALLVRVVGLASSEGHVAVALYGSESSFASGEGAVATARLEIVDGAAEWLVPDLPFGRYALKAFHDRNANRELDRGRFGIPKEPYGFSNGARSKTGPPSFDKARFLIDQARIEVEVSVRP
jgi:uncharacterized protein (DUF2141 family)